MLFPDEPPAFETVCEDGDSPFVFLCDHASSRVPRRLGDLGLDDAARRAHIAWDIGAADVARRLSDRFRAPLVLSGYSRLAIDCNRPPGVAASIPEVTCEIPVPGNVGLTEEHRAAREDALFRPYHGAIERLLARRDAAGRASVIVSMHSFTPSLYGRERPWNVSVLYGKDARFAAALMASLSRVPGLVVGDNTPYRVSDGTDYGIPVYAERAGRLGALVELRQDQLESAVGVAAMADVMAGALTRVLDAGLPGELPDGADAPQG